MNGGNVLKRFHFFIDGIKRIPNIIGAFIFSFMLLLALFNIEWLKFHLVAILIIIILVIFLKISKFELKYSALFMNFFVVYIIISFYIALKIRVVPSWDFKGIFDNAVTLAGTGKLYDRIPLERYPNNIFPVFIYALWYRLFYLIGKQPEVTDGIILNAIFIYISIWFTFKTCRIIFNEKYAFVCSGLMFLFLPMIGYMPILYTDTMSMPCVIISIYIETLLNKELIKKKEKVIFLRIMEGIILAIGFKIKATVAIILMAIILNTIIELFNEMGLKQKKNKAGTIIIILSFIFFVLCINKTIETSGLFDKKECYDVQFPYTHWVKMGLNGHGGWNSADVNDTMEIKGYEEKQQENIVVIKERIMDYRLTGLFELMKKKAMFTWGDGTYYVSNKLNRQPQFDNFLSNFFRLTGQNNEKFILYCNTFHAILMILILISIGGSILLPCKEQLQNILQFSLYGLTLFLMIWETRSRYLLNWLPIFIILSGYGLRYLVGKNNIAKEY